MAIAQSAVLRGKAQIIFAVSPHPVAVENLARDERFADNPAVRTDPAFRFYAGAPVLDADGFALGSLCVVDKKPRTLSAEDAEILRSLAYVTSEAVQSRTAKSRLRRM